MIQQHPYFLRVEKGMGGFVGLYIRTQAIKLVNLYFIPCYITIIYSIFDSNKLIYLFWTPMKTINFVRCLWLIDIRFDFYWVPDYADRKSLMYSSPLWSQLGFLSFRCLTLDYINRKSPIWSSFPFNYDLVSNLSGQYRVLSPLITTGFLFFQVFNFRLHKQKVTNIEFSPREEWLLCTSSIDQTVQFWDVRMMKDRKSSLYVLKHDKGVNSGELFLLMSSSDCTIQLFITYYERKWSTIPWIWTKWTTTSHLNSLNTKKRLRHEQMVTKMQGG